MRGFTLGRRYILAVVGLMLVVAFGAATLWLTRGLSDAGQEFCDGVQDTLGGCAEDQPTFVGETCDDVAREFGAQLDRRAVAVLNGPDVVGGERKSVRMAANEFLLVTRANQHLRRIGIVSDCDADAFLETAETEFSELLRSNAGDYLYEFERHPYTEWLANLRKTLRAIDTDEDDPA